MGIEAVSNGRLVWKAGESARKMGMMEPNESKCGGGGKSCAFQVMILSKNNESIIFPVPGAGIMTWWPGRTGMRRMCVVLVIEKYFSPVVGAAINGGCFQGWLQRAGWL